MSERIILSFIAIICIFFVACSLGMQGEPFTTLTANHESSRQMSRYIKSTIARSHTTSWKWRSKKIGDENLTALQVLNANDAWIVDEQGTLYKTTDGGDTWRPIKIDKPSGSDVTGLFFADSSLGWVSVTRTPSDVLDIQSFESWLLQTRDGGSSWQVQYSGHALQLGRVVFINSQEGWSIGSKQVKRETIENDYFILHTVDQGNHWIEVSNDLNPDIAGGSIDDIYVLEPSQALVLTDSRKIFSTTKDGQSWQQVGVVESEPPQTGMFRMGLLNNGDLWVLGGAGGREGTWTTLAFKDSAGSWLKYRADGVILRDVTFLSKYQVVACGTLASNDTLPLLADDGREGVLLHSSDGGHNWSIVYRSAQIKSINALAAVNYEHIWAVGDDGLILQIEPALTNQSSYQK